MLDERRYSPMNGESEDVKRRLDEANELAVPASVDAEKFVNDYVDEVASKLAAGELGDEHLEYLLAKIRKIQDSKGH